MRIDQSQTSEHEHSTRKRRRRNTLFSNYIQEFAAQVATTENYINVENGSYGPSLSQHVWLMIVDRLRKEVLNARDCHRADTLSRSQLLTPIAPPPPPPSSYDCSVCMERKSMAKTVCVHFLCWECLCKWDKKGPLKKLCPCCNTILSRSHIIFMDQKPDDDNKCDTSSIFRFPIDSIPYRRSAETQPVWTETISSPTASVDKVNPFPPLANEKPTWSTSLISELGSCSSSLFLDDVWPKVELHGKLFNEQNLSCNSCNTCNTVESSSSSIKRLNTANSDPSQSHTLSTNIGAGSTAEAIQMQWKQGQQFGGFSCNSNIAADSFEALDSLNERDLDCLLDENICNWSLLEEMFPL